MSQDSKKTILGLDLGTNSIGWALIETDNSEVPNKILGMGSRIIPLDSTERDQFQQGQAITKNQDRTKSRTQRKGYDRLQLRKSALKELLRDLNIWPTEALMKLPSLELWKLRSDAASKALQPGEFGRVLYMLNQKRGYKSARSEANADKKDTEYVAEVKGRYARLKEVKKTIGQYFYNELKNAEQNQQHFQVKKKVYPREAYLEEFDAIIKTQKVHHSFLTDEVVYKLRDEIIYYQRKLKSQKNLVSVCEFEGFETAYIDNETQKQKTIFAGPKVAPRTSPLFQLCRIWETVNNISLKVRNSAGSRYKWSDKIPTLEEKTEIVRRLWKSEHLSQSELLKILNLKKEDVYANKQLQKGIKGNSTYVQLQKIIDNTENLTFNVHKVASSHQCFLVDERTGEIVEELEPIQLDASFVKEPLYQIWHTIYSIKDLEECKLALIKRFGFEENIAAQLAGIDFNSPGFGNKSSKAMRKILPYLMQGFNYADACSLAGYNHSKSLTKSEQQKRTTADRLELLPKNALRQPVVEKILNQMINVVNAIIEKHGKPDEIRVELARELKQSKEEREGADRQNNFNKALNDEIGRRLQEYQLPATRRYIQKYKFLFPTRDKKWKEAQVFNQCIYCGESFNITEALRGDDFDVDHIVPKTLLFDDSQTNKVLVHRSCNSNKTNQTAYDFIAKQGETALSSYISRVDDWYKRGVLSYGKMQRLKVSFEEYQERKRAKKETEADKRLWENFIDRQLRETQYIVKKSKELLQNICNNVSSSEGGVTAKLRQLWGWNDVLMNLQLPKYKNLGQTQIRQWTSDHGKRVHEKEEILNWSKRDDHRHHAIDALVIACTRQGFIQRINTLSSSDVKDEMNRNVEEARLEYNEKLTLLDKYLITQRPPKFTTSFIEQEADKILISFKAGKKVATISKRKATGKNRDTGVIVPRGALHEQFVYGKINVNGKASYVLKYKLQDLKSKDVPSIVDKKVRELVSQRLKAFGGKEKEAFKDVLWFNEEKQIPILSVRCLTGLSAVEPVKRNEFGREIGFAKPGSNHHVAIYKDVNGKYVQHLCTFWHAVERKKHGIPCVVKDSRIVWNDILTKNLPSAVLEKLPSDNLKLEFSLQENEMFVLNLPDEEFNSARDRGDYALISRYLYVVWSVSKNKYWFRHHLETKNTELKKTPGARESGRFIEVSSVDGFLKLIPKKIRLNHLGEITKIGE